MPAYLDRAGTARPHAAGDEVRVPVDEVDVVQRDAEDARHDLPVDGVVALAVRARSRDDGDPTAREDLDRGVLHVEAERAGRHLDVEAHADAEVRAAAPAAPRPLLGPQPLVVDQLERRVEAALVVAGVVLHPGQRRVRELFGSDEVAATQLDGIDVELAGQHVHGPLQQGDALGTSGAPEGTVGAVLVATHLASKRT